MRFLVSEVPLYGIAYRQVDERCTGVCFTKSVRSPLCDSARLGITLIELPLGRECKLLHRRVILEAVNQQAPAAIRRFNLDLEAAQVPNQFRRIPLTMKITLP